MITFVEFLNTVLLSPRWYYLNWGSAYIIIRSPLYEITGPELLRAHSVNWSVNKQYMDFLHSLWARSVQLSSLGPCPYFRTFVSLGLVDRCFVGWVVDCNSGRIIMRQSTCGTVMLVCATILGPITIVFLAVSFATDHWLEFKVARDKFTGSNDLDRVAHTRYRGIFRECYPGNDTACK